MTFNFNDIKRETFDVILPTEKDVSLHILRPLKGEFEKLIEVSEELSEISKNRSATPEQRKTLNEISAMVLSRNLEGKIFTEEDIEKKFDVDDLFFLIDSYLDFIFLLANIKN